MSAMWDSVYMWTHVGTIQTFHKNQWGRERCITAWGRSSDYRHQQEHANKMQRAWRREGGRERGREKRKFVGTYDPANLLDRGRSALLESHAATNDRLAIRRGPIEHALKQCVPVLMYDGDRVQVMETQGVVFVNAKQLCFHAAAAAAAAAALHPPWWV